MCSSRVPVPKMAEVVELLQSSLGSKSGDLDICLWDSLLIPVKIKHKVLRGEETRTGNGHTEITLSV